MALTDKLTAIADAVREKAGTTEAMTLTQIAEAIAGIETGGSQIFGAPVEYGSFVRTSDSYDHTVSHTLGTFPSGCIFWPIDDIVANTTAASYTLGCYISNESGGSPFSQMTSASTMTWGTSLIAGESTAADTAGEGKAYARHKFPTGGSIGSVVVGSSMTYTVCGMATNSNIRLGGTGGKFLAGIEYRYILFGGGMNP